jgi:mono/diheme cytochrome c family protein
MALAAVLVVSGMVRADVDKPTKFSNMGSVGNTRHNMTQRPYSGGGPSPALMDIYRNNYGEVCVYCHTPHGGNASVKLPLWNRTMKTTTYSTYSSLSLTQTVMQPGVNSLACLSCHDGQVAVDSIINMPGSGRYDATSVGQENPDFLDTWVNRDGSTAGAHMRLTECMACHSPTAGPVGRGATDFTAFLIGTDLRDDHPIGVSFPFSQVGVNFREPRGARANIKFFDENGNGVPDKEEVRLFDSGNGNGYQVECSSCHDPHGVPSGGKGSVFNPTFLRVASAGSSICLTCHIK